MDLGGWSLPSGMALTLLAGLVLKRGENSASFAFRSRSRSGSSADLLIQRINIIHILHISF